MALQKILIVDSDLEAGGALAAFLFGRGYGVVQATDGQAGRRLFLSERPQLVITETILPLLHGFELCAKVRKDPRPVPVFFLSEACEDESFRAEAKRVFGAAAYLIKPFDGEVLLAEMKRALAPPAAPPPKAEEPVKAPAPPEAPPPPAETKKERRIRPLEDVDALVNEALAEVGLDLDPKEVPPKPAPPPAPQTQEMSVAALDDLLARERPVSRPAAADPPLPPEDLPEAEKTVSPNVPEEVRDFVPRRRTSWAKRAAAGAGLLFVVSALVFIFAAKKPAPPTVPPLPKTAATPAAEKPRFEDAAYVTTAEVLPPVLQKAEPVEKPKEEAIPGPLLPSQVPPAKITLPEVRLPEAKPGPETAPEPRAEVSRPPLAKTAAGDLVELTAVDRPPRLVSSVEPVYPPRALERRVEGEVSFRVLISETGSLQEVRLVQGPGGGMGFESAARKAISSWRYAPAEKDGVPVRVWKPVTVSFKLPRREP
jgi:protein TonB